MKNTVGGVIALILTVWLCLGCGIIEKVQKTVTEEKPTSADANRNLPAADGNKSVTDRAVEAIADGETTGVPECDEVLKIFSDQMQSKDDNWASKATKDYIFGQIKKSFRKSLEENKNDKTKMAEQCRDYKTQLDKQIKAEQDKQK